MTLSDQPVYKLRNARWPDYYAYVSAVGTVWVSKKTDSTSEFTVLVPPREPTSQPTAPTHLIYSKEWPDSAMFVTYNLVCTRNSQGYQTCQEVYPAVSHRVTGAVGGLLPSPSLTDLGVRLDVAPVENPNPGRTLLMIGSLKYAQQYLYVPMTNFDQVVGWRTDPGASGYWYFDPELPRDILERIPRYTGPRCGWACGTVAVLPTPAPEPNSTDVFLSGAADCRMSTCVSAVASAAMFFSVLLGVL